MKSIIAGNPAFAHIHVDLEPGESILAESNAMSSMAADLDLKAIFAGGFLVALLRKLFGGESLFMSQFSNNTKEPKQVTLVQATPGEIREVELNDQSLCLQPGAYLASTPKIKIGLKWAGLKSFLAREGLFKLEVSGSGKVWYGAYGCLVEKQVDGEYLVDSGHLVAYDPQMKLGLQFAGGFFSSILGGEGLVLRMEGKGKIILQSRSLSGLVGWLNPKIRG